VALGQAAPSGPRTSGTWACLERPGRAARRARAGAGRVEQVRSSHHLSDTLLGVVHNDRQVVGEDAVVAADDEVVDDALHRSAQAVLERQPLAARAHAQRRRTAARPPRLALGGGQAQARAGIGALRQRPVGAEAASRISARVHQHG
jgi:hypothetical protein